MKNLLIILSLGLIGCDISHTNTKTVKVQTEYTTIIIEDCEYIMLDYKNGYSGYGFLAHKGNCKNHKS